MTDGDEWGGFFESPDASELICSVCREKIPSPNNYYYEHEHKNYCRKCWNSFISSLYEKGHRRI